MEEDGDSNLAAHLHMRQLYNEKWEDQQVPELLAQANPSTGLKHFCSMTPIMSLGFSCAKEWYGICVCVCGEDCWMLEACAERTPMQLSLNLRGPGLRMLG